MQKGFSPVIIVLSLVIIAVVVSGAFFLGRATISRSIPQNDITTSQAPQATLSSSPKTFTPDETANWKSYTDPKGIFSFKYPEKVNQGEVLLKNSPATVSEILPITKNGVKFSPEDVLASVSIYHVYSVPYPNGDPDPFSLGMTVWKNKENTTTNQVKEALLAYKPAPGPYQDSFMEIKDYQSGEIKGVYYEVINDQSHQEIYMATNNKLYRFYFNAEGSSTGGRTRELIDQILSTFKFTQ